MAFSVGLGRQLAIREPYRYINLAFAITSPRFARRSCGTAPKGKTFDADQVLRRCRADGPKKRNNILGTGNSIRSILMQQLASIQTASANPHAAAVKSIGANAGNTAAAVKTAAAQPGATAAQNDVTLSVKALNLSQANPATGSMPVHSMTSPSGPKPANYGAGMYQSVAKLG
jgi:hypothetical protein